MYVAINSCAVNSITSQTNAVTRTWMLNSIPKFSLKQQISRPSTSPLTAFQEIQFNMLRQKAAYLMTITIYRRV